MGMVFLFPCSGNNHVVSIIGTHLENNFIDQINSKKKHPALNCDVLKSSERLNLLKGWSQAIRRTLIQ